MKLSLTLFALSLAIETRSISAVNTTRNLKSYKSTKSGKGSSKAPKGGKGGKGSSKAPKDVKSSKSPKSSKAGKGGKGGSSGPGGGPDKITLPEIGSVIDGAFPMWEIDGDGNRVTKKPCTVDSCEWNPYYITKRYDGLHPDLGGHPTDLDVHVSAYELAMCP